MNLLKICQCSWNCVPLQIHRSLLFLAPLLASLPSTLIWPWSCKLYLVNTLFKQDNMLEVVMWYKITGSSILYLYLLIFVCPNHWSHTLSPMGLCLFTVFFFNSYYNHVIKFPHTFLLDIKIVKSDIIEQSIKRLIFYVHGLCPSWVFPWLNARQLQMEHKDT